MELLTIGAFATKARLSPKALRLYDELGLLPPAAVDPSSGYRYYAPAQLERARLVAWLRRLGMPLARIRAVCDLDPPAAARAVAAYWDEVLRDVAARGRLADFLVDYLSGRGSTVSHDHPTMGVRYAARCDRGRLRASNEDAAYAGTRLLAVADGISGPAGHAASAAAIDALKPLEDAVVPADELLNVLGEAVQRADRAVGQAAGAGPSGGPATTLTALLWSGPSLALVHIGDSRAYLLRDRELLQITHDHTYVQSLVDQGQLTPDEAVSHPQRALLVRALDGTGRYRPDLSLHEPAVGDRYLLCSDGLSAVVPRDRLYAVLGAGRDPERTVEELIELAHQAGAPDNIACVVADVVAV